MADPSDKGHALRWLRAQPQSDQRDFIVSLAAANVHLAMEAVERVELRGDFLTDAIKPYLDANVAVSLPQTQGGTDSGATCSD